MYSYKTQRKKSEDKSNPQTLKKADHPEGAFHGRQYVRLNSENTCVDAPLQLKVKTGIKNQTKNNVHLVANGFVNEFNNGEDAGDYGWNGVEKYLARYKIVDNGLADSTTVLSNDYLQAHAGHSLARQNGGVGDNINIFAQDGGVNTTGPWIKFENKMRSDLNKSDDDFDVEFEMFLAGSNITNGKLVTDRMPSLSFSKSEKKFFGL